MNIIDRLENIFKGYEKISPILVKRYAKMELDFCEDMCTELRKRRIEKGDEKPPRKKWERRK